MTGWLIPRERDGLSCLAGRRAAQFPTGSVVRSTPPPTLWLEVHHGIRITTKELEGLTRINR